ncbi:MAG TPA: hypothetical protein DE315_08540 [Candidatus Omnitrophica bacterium]|nr:MAG: hypothetical protein A2Y05_01315 [Omnitrophica WOR_2 bacterium GWA2_53_43]OGX30192.1 MAG: hypothetical protein A2705_05170 [Omnitrophica WOR_2 bacterium RIFCSPHIGHO2_01_FULL_52_10]HBO96453.1 hypothetical protein [Candidatus Omnitrophota bacterium]HCI45557.1 hypothetical protein [Candidatus Omnitrophota bacterium]
MIKIRELENDVLSLPEKAFVRFSAWFHRVEAEKWDRKFEKDVCSGKLDRFGSKALKDFAKGKCKEL